jgi:predicted MFS family arabinose efflux permease
MTANRWLMLAILFLARTAMGFQFQTVGSLAPVLVETFDISYARLGTLIGLYLLPGVIIALPGGMLGDRFGGKRVAVMGLALMAVGGFAMTLSASFATAVVAHVVSGAGAILLNVAVTKMVADWFAGREVRTAMAVLITSWPFGIALGLVLFAPLQAAFGWQAVMLTAAAFCALQLIVVALVYVDPEGETRQSDGGLTLDLTAREWQLVLIAGTIWGMFNVGYIVLVSFLPELFVSRGYTLPHATGIASLLGWTLIVTVPLGGYLADHLHRPNAVLLFGLLVTATATALLAVGPAALPAYAVMLLFAGLPGGPIMALPASALRPQARGTGMGIYYAWSYGLMATFPALAGLARDLTDSAAAPILFAASTAIVAAAGLAVFRLAARRPAAAA